MKKWLGLAVFLLAAPSSASAATATKDDPKADKAGKH